MAPHRGDAPVQGFRSYRGLFDRRVWILTYGQVIQSLGRGVLMPFATLYYYNVRHFPLASVGLAFAVAFPLGAIVGLLWGVVTDRVGRKPLMVVGYGGSAITSAALAFVQTVPQFFLVVIASSVLGGASRPASRAMVADITPGDRRTRAYGLLYMANNLGMSLGLLVGGVLAIFLPYRLLFFAEAGGSALYLVVILAMVGETFRGAGFGGQGAPAGRVRGLGTVLATTLGDLRKPLGNRAFLVYGLAGILGGLGWNQFYITYSPYLKNVLHAPDAAIGAVFAVNTVMVVLLQVPIANWAETHRRTRVFEAGNLLLAVSLVLTSAAALAGGPLAALAVVVVAVVIMTLGEIMRVPVSSALVAGLAGTQEDYGKYMATSRLMGSLGRGAGAVLGGAFFDAHLEVELWPIIALLALASVGVYAWLGRLLPAELDAPGGPEPPSPPRGALAGGSAGPSDGDP